MSFIDGSYENPKRQSNSKPLYSPNDALSYSFTFRGKY